MIHTHPPVTQESVRALFVFRFCVVSSPSSSRPLSPSPAVWGSEPQRVRASPLLSLSHVSLVLDHSRSRVVAFRRLVRSAPRRYPRWRRCRPAPQLRRVARGLPATQPRTYSTGQQAPPHRPSGGGGKGLESRRGWGAGRERRAGGTAVGGRAKRRAGRGRGKRLAPCRVGFVFQPLLRHLLEDACITHWRCEQAALRSGCSSACRTASRALWDQPRDASQELQVLAAERGDGALVLRVPPQRMAHLACAPVRLQDALQHRGVLRVGGDGGSL